MAELLEDTIIKKYYPTETEEILRKYILRVIKRPNEDLWDVVVGNWLNEKEDIQNDYNLKTTKPITMNKKGLKILAKEIRRMVRKKPADETELRLSLCDDEPQLRIRIFFVYPNSHWDWSDTRGKFSFSVGINVWFSYVKYGGYEKYVYDHGGMHDFMNRYFTAEELQKFADDLEKEAGDS